MSDNIRGAVLMMVSMLAFTLSDSLIKAVGGQIPLFQMLFLRGILTTLLILGLAWQLGALRLDFSRRDWGLIGVRSVAEVGETLLFLSALWHMPLANLTALLQLLPLTVTLGAAIFFREPLGWRRMSAILIGFMGMLLIVRPGTEGFNFYTIHALGAVALITVRDLATRRLSRDVPNMFVTLTAAFSVLLFGGIASLTIDWQPMTATLWALLAGSAVMILAGYLTIIAVMRVGDLAVTTSFRYTGLVWALILGWAIFDEWPANLTLIGAAIIAATGLFTLYRETQINRQAKTRRT